MANILPFEKQTAVIHHLCEGLGVRATERLTDTSRETVLSLLVRVGEGCEALHNGIVRDLKPARIECDELWGYVARKQRQMRGWHDLNTEGDQWTWVALDPDSKLVASYRVGKRDSENARALMSDLSMRIAPDRRVQISTDGLASYADAIERSFGATADYAQVVKEYEAEPIGPGRYSPPQVSRVEKTIIAGNPDLDDVTTSHVERLNLSIRMENRRHTRLTNAFSKKIRNHRAATALFFAHYNLCRSHKTLRMTPAMAANVTDHPWEVSELVAAALGVGAA